MFVLNKLLRRRKNIAYFFSYSAKAADALDNENKKRSFILYCSRLIVTLAAPKLLTLDNENKKTEFYFVLFSLNRNFAVQSITPIEVLWKQKVKSLCLVFRYRN